jgi:type IV pilus assembly protein PilO
MALSDKMAPITEKVRAKLSTIDEKQRLYIFIGVLLFLFVLDYLVLMRPQLGTLTKINPEIDILAKDIALAKEQIAKENSYKEQVEELKQSVRDINHRVRSRSEVPLILERLSLLANNSGIVIDQIMPQTVDQEILLENDQYIYYSLPIRITAKGGYHSFGKFIASIEGNDMFLTIGVFDITSKFGVTNHAINLTVNAVIYEVLN